MDYKMEKILEWLIILSLSTKNSHWNLRGTDFFFLHEKLDEVNADILEYADLLAERGRAIGLYLAPKISYEFTNYHISCEDAKDELRTNLRSLTRELQDAILNITDDLTTQDVLIEIQRGVDKWLWMFEESGR